MILRVGMSLGASVAIALSLSSCAATSEGAEQRDAVIVTPNAASRAALQQAVAKLVGQPVTLADDALTRASSLTIERTAARDPSGRRIEARETAMPQSVRLVKRGSSCVLIHDASGAEVVLNDVACQPVN